MPVSPEIAWVLSDQIGHAYARLLNATQSHFEGEEVRVPEFVAMVILTNFPEGITQTIWGTYQGVSRQRAHVIAKKLVARRLVEVERVGRSSRVRLTADGHALISQLQPAVSAHLASLLAPLSQQEAETLSSLLSRVLPLP